jgi:hypothetical protein
LVITQKPVPSQYKILRRVRRGLMNTNKVPVRGSSPRRSVTSPCSPWKLLRRSIGCSAHAAFKAARETQHGVFSHARNILARAAQPPPVCPSAVAVANRRRSGI